MMSDEKKPKETWPEVQAEVSKVEGNAESDSAAAADGEDRTNFFVWLLVACSSISGLLFGAFSIQFSVLSISSAITYTVINVRITVNRLRHWRYLRHTRYHWLRPWPNGALLWTKGRLSWYCCTQEVGLTDLFQ